MGYRTLYGHLSVIRVKEGQQVKRGQLIGDVGSTGVSSGPHLHFEIQDWGKPVDPIPYVGSKPSTDRVKLPRMLTAY
jgi:murein DD-endopeptidase MepM/ murein hydrolase activator NlpD